MAKKEQLYNKKGEEVLPITDVRCVGNMSDGRNLLLNSGTPVTNGEYNIANYYFCEEKPIEGEICTITVKANLANVRNHNILLYNSSGSVQFFDGANASKMVYIGNNLYRATGVVRQSAKTEYLALYIGNPGATEETSTIEWIKLEKGANATAWTPAIEEYKDYAKQALFDDMWLQAVRTYGSIDRENHPTEPYILEGIPHTYEEAIYTYKFGIIGHEYPSAGPGLYNGKVILWYCNQGGGIGSQNHAFFNCPNLEIIRVAGNCKIAANYSFYRVPKLRKVLSGVQWDVGDTTNMDTSYRPFYSSPLLEEMALFAVHDNVSFENCPLLSFNSLRVLVDRRSTNTTKAFSVIVHSDVYSKLTDPENTEWYQLNQDAISKNITFATA